MQIAAITCTAQCATQVLNAPHYHHVSVSTFDPATGQGHGNILTGLFGELTDTTVAFSAKDLLPAVPHPGKIICVGLNYRKHIEEMGHPIPEHPTLFAKFSSALAAPYSEVTVPAHMSAQADYEGELAVIIGPDSSIGGYAIMNDFSQRDWQYRTQQWLQGKNLDSSSALGPWITTDVDPYASASVLRTWVNGELRQEHSIGDVVFSPRELVDYIGQFTTLSPGDVIATGTPHGVGHGMHPAQYLRDGDEVRIAIDGLGEVVQRFWLG